MSNNYICGLKIHYLRFLVLFSLILLFMTSCFDQPDCLVTATNMVQIYFKKKDKHSADTTLTIASIRVSGTDSVFYDSAKVTTQVATLLLPVNPRDTVTTYLVAHDKTTDTLTIRYSSHTKIISTECGAFSFYGNLKVLKFINEADRYKIVNPQLVFDPTSQKYASNLLLYY